MSQGTPGCVCIVCQAVRSAKIEDEYRIVLESMARIVAKLKTPGGLTIQGMAWGKAGNVAVFDGIKMLSKSYCTGETDEGVRDAVVAKALGLFSVWKDTPAVEENKTAEDLKKAVTDALTDGLEVWKAPKGVS